MTFPFMLPSLRSPAPPGRVVRASSSSRLKVLLSQGGRDRFVVVDTVQGRSPVLNLEWYDVEGRLASKARLAPGEFPCGFSLADGSVPVANGHEYSAVGTDGRRAWPPCAFPAGTEMVLAASSDGSLVALGGEHRLVVQIRGEKAKPPRLVTMPFVGDVAFSGDGRTMVVGALRGEGDLRVVRTSDMRTIGRMRLPEPQVFVRWLSFGGSSDRVVVGTENRFWVFDLRQAASPRLLHPRAFSGWFEDWNAAEGLAVTTPDRMAVNVIDLASGKSRIAFDASEPSFYDARLLRGGHLVYVEDFSKVRLLPVGLGRKDG